MQTPRGEKTKRIGDGIGEKVAYVHTFLSKQHLSRRESVDLRVTLASGGSFVSPFSPSPPSHVMVHGLIPITMNLSDVKTQSPPESGLPSSALRPGDHKSRGICDRISYTSWHIPACNADAVKEAVKSERDLVGEKSSRWKLEGEERDGKRRGRREEGEKRRERERKTWSAWISLRSMERRRNRRKNRGDCTERRRKLQTRKLSEALLSPTRPPSGTKGVVRYTSISKYSTFLQNHSRLLRGLFRKSEKGEDGCEKESRLETSGWVSENRTGRWGKFVGKMCIVHFEF